MPARFELSTPDNQRKLEAADALAQLAGAAGLSLIHLALAFVMQHPAVTAPITAHPRPSESPSASIRANKDRVTIEVLPPHTALTAYGTAGPPDTSFPHIAATHEPPE